MTDIVERLRGEPRKDECKHQNYICVPGDCPCNSDDMLEAADEIERLRDAIKLLMPHVEHMLKKAEDAAKVDTKFIRNRLNHARTVLGEGK